MKYAIEIRDEDRHLLNVTNIGVFAEHAIQNTDYRQLATASREVFDNWCETLKKAKRLFKVIPGGYKPN